MKFKRGLIRVAQWKGGLNDAQESFIEVPGLLGNHLGITTAKGEIYWSITHLKTGYQVTSGIYFKNFKTIRAMVEELETAKGINWEFQDPTKVSATTRKNAERIIKKYREMEFKRGQ